MTVTTRPWHNRCLCHTSCWFHNRSGGNNINSIKKASCPPIMIANTRRPYFQQKRQYQKISSRCYYDTSSSIRTRTFNRYPKLLETIQYISPTSPPQQCHYYHSKSHTSATKNRNSGPQNPIRGRLHRHRAPSPMSQCKLSHYSTNAASSSSSSGELPNHKLLLHKIVKSVHPDYFSQYPEQQKANTVALQSLYEWINEFDAFDFKSARAPSFQRVGRRFPVQFFIKMPSRDAANNGTTTSSAQQLPQKQSSFQSISDTLFGPVGSLGVNEKHRQLCSGLVVLMKKMQLSIPSQFQHLLSNQQRRSTFSPQQQTVDGENTHTSSHSSPFSHHDSPEFSILHFLHSIPQHKLNAAAVAKDAQMMARVDVDLFRNRIAEFLNATGIHMRAYSGATASSQRQLQLIHRFLQTLEDNFPGLDTRYWNRKQVRQTSVYAANEKQTTIHRSERHNALRERASGMIFYIDEGYCRIEDDGSIVLGTDQDPQEWLQYIEHEFDPEEASIKRQYKSIIHDLERAAARRLGIVLVVAESEELSITREYGRFLEDLIECNPKELGLVDLGEEFYDGVYLVMRERQTTLALEDSTAEEQQQDEEEAVRVHPRFGFIEANLGDVTKIVEGVADVSTYARFVSERNQRQVKQVNHHTNLVRRRMGLHTITVAKNLTPQQVLSCCQQLMNHAHELSPILKGTNLIISDGFKFHGEAIEILWNYQF